jgi:hypothetical protein
MNAKRLLSLKLALVAALCSAGASANCFNTSAVWCDGTVRAIHVRGDGKVMVSLGNSIGGALGCGTLAAPVGAPAAEYVLIDPALPQYAEKYQAVLVAGAALSSVLVYLVPNSQGQCAISSFMVIP